MHSYTLGTEGGSINKYIYIYIYIYLFIYLFVYVYVFIDVCIGVYIHICIYYIERERLTQLGGDYIRLSLDYIILH